jgi:gas vesicle protein
MSKGKFALGALFGAVVGVAAGILTAPKSGKETRADLRTKADELKGQATEKAHEVKSKATEAAEDVKTKAEELKGRTERAVEGAKQGFNSKK